MNKRSPGQLYETPSGLLFHAGKICVALVGLPARGKTHLAVALARYLSWLGVNTETFHLGNYRRQLAGEMGTIPDDYFFMEQASAETRAFRAQVEGMCAAAIYDFFESERNGQVAIYDAVNGSAASRRQLASTLSARGIQTLFVECICTREDIVARNIKDVKLSSPDYKGMDPEQAIRKYKQRLELRIPRYQTMAEPELSYVKLINVSERFIINRAQLGFLPSRIMFFLMNLKLKSGSVFFACVGESNNDSFKSDHPLDSGGETLATRLRTTLLAHLSELETPEENQQENSASATTDLQIPMIPGIDYGLDSSDCVSSQPEISLEGLLSIKTDSGRNPISRAASSNEIAEMQRLKSVHGLDKLTGHSYTERTVLGRTYTGQGLEATSRVTTIISKDDDGPIGDELAEQAALQLTNNDPSNLESIPVNRVLEALSLQRAQASSPRPQVGSLKISEPTCEIWSSPRRRTSQTAEIVARDTNFRVRIRPQLTQRNPGVADMLSEQELAAQYAQEYAKHREDPYHHRFSRAESYHDVAVRLEPLIMELERVQGHVLIIGHESVLRVLFGYLMACTVATIPTLQFKSDEIVEVIPHAYQNRVRRIPFL